MVVVELDDNPGIIYGEDEIQGHKRKGICVYKMGREADALLVLLFGLGVLIFVIGLCTGLYAVAHGFVGWVASWVLGFALRAYFGTWMYRDTIDYEAERL